MINCVVCVTLSMGRGSQWSHQDDIWQRARPNERNSTMESKLLSRPFVEKYIISKTIGYGEGQGQGVL